MKFRLEPEVRPVVTSALALSGAVGVFALAFGVLAVGAGANVWQACALSFFTFTGASQLSAMTVIGTGGSVGGALLSTSTESITIEIHSTSPQGGAGWETQRVLQFRKLKTSVSQSVSYFTVPPRAHPSTGSQS